MAHECTHKEWSQPVPVRHIPALTTARGLEEVMAAWRRLPRYIRRAILTLVERRGLDDLQRDVLHLQRRRQLVQIPQNEVGLDRSHVVGLPLLRADRIDRHDSRSAWRAAACIAGVSLVRRSVRNRMSVRMVDLLSP
jgi:hypothetical protein